MNTPNTVLMSQAREVLKGKWGLAVKITFLYCLLSTAVSFIPLAGSIVSLIITGPLTLGLAGFWLAFSKREYLSFSKILDGFNDFWRAFKAYILMMIYIMLWALLLIIPGIIAAYSYAVTFFILSEDKSIGANAAISKSKELMKGNKFKLFRLHLQFIGRWLLLLAVPVIILILTDYPPQTQKITAELFVLPIILFFFVLAIGIFWLMPYMYVTFAKFYEDIKNNQVEIKDVPEVVAVPQA